MKRFITMHWKDKAIVISSRHYGENALVVTAFTHSHGLYRGLIKGLKQGKITAQPGNLVEVNWNARLPEHLGMFTLELLESITGYILHDKLKLAGLASACALIQAALPDQDPHPRLFESFSALLRHIKASDTWLDLYIRFELDMLKELGYGLDFSRCAATGGQENLIYISPKSGGAVSSEAGEPYKEKLLPLPPFLLNGSSPNSAEILDALRLTGYFLQQFMEHHHAPVPSARIRLSSLIRS